MIFEDTITIDTTHVLVDEAPATYEIDADWGPRRHGRREVWSASTATLVTWGDGYPRSLAVALAGEEWVQRAEDMARDAWLERAASDDADDWADERRDLRDDAA